MWLLLFYYACFGAIFGLIVSQLMLLSDHRHQQSARVDMIAGAVGAFSGASIYMHYSQVTEITIAGGASSFSLAFLFLWFVQNNRKS